MSYQLASNACNGPNGTKPLPAQLVARMIAQLNNLDTAEAAAKNAVLGYCTNPGSYNLGVNIQNEVAAAPSPSSIVQNLTAADIASVGSGTAATGTSSVTSAPASTATPAGSSAAGSLVSAGGPPVGYAPGPGGVNRACWSDQPVSVVPLQGSIPVQPPVPSLSLPDPSNAGLGDYPPWGDSFANASPASSVSGWLSANPGLVAAGLLFAVALLFGEK